MQGHIESCSQPAAFTEGLNHSLDRYHWAKLVRQLKENLDKLHVAKSKFHVKCSSLWTMEDEFGPNQQVGSNFHDSAMEDPHSASSVLAGGNDIAMVSLIVFLSFVVGNTSRSLARRASSSCRYHLAIINAMILVQNIGSRQVQYAGNLHLLFEEESLCRV